MSLFASKNTYYLPDGFEAKGNIGWQSPSNIALVKYWGKRDYQLPQNPSISFTLSKAVTQTELEYHVNTSEEKLRLDFWFAGKREASFLPKLNKHLNFVAEHIYPFIYQMSLRIDSDNTFPHSSGIASSASAMSALAACLVSIEKQLFNPAMTETAFLQKVSYIARLGSGSAARSVYPIAALWGQTAENDDSSDLWAIPMENELAPVFKTYRDAILIVSRDKKSVSSRAGHGLMETNPYAAARYKQARAHLSELLPALQSGDIEKFNTIVESEALSLHGLMMSSRPAFTLLKPNTLKIIELLREFRQNEHVPLSFTLDAGPNVHVLYPDSYKNKVIGFIENELKPHLEVGQWIDDGTGNGLQAI